VVDAGVIHYGSQAMKAANYQWSGGGRPEWDALRSANLARFVEVWKPFMRARNVRSPAEEVPFLLDMNRRLVAEAGDRKTVPPHEIRKIWRALSL
jgi:hypothetical protein